MKPASHVYWYSISASRVALMGIFPPPLGGVSVHIQRVMDCFSLQNNRIFFWNTERQLRRIFPLYALILMWWLIRNRPKHLYYHSTYISTSTFELMILVMIRYIVRYQLHIVDHDCRHLYRRGRLAKRMYQWIAKRLNSIVCIGESTYQSYSDNGIIDGNFFVQDAFIPPIKRTASSITMTYPSSLTSFIIDNTPLLLISAAHLMRIDGKDVYGVDTALYLLATIQDEFPDAGLIIGLPRIGDVRYFAQLQDIMRKLHICERVYIVCDNKEIWPLFKQIDLFLRPTLTDGDSISIREALYFNVPVIASNVCSRPRGVYCYTTGDMQDMVRVTKKVLKEYVYTYNFKRNHLHA